MRLHPTATLTCGRFYLSLARPLVMGIVNVTPDSFQDVGRFADHELAIAHARQLIAEGADILDIGGESTRPGAEPVSVAEELSRVLPVVQALMDANVPLSVDTRRPEVMRAAIAAGADMINDVNGFRSVASLQAVSDASQRPVAICAMHMQGEPLTMQLAPTYRQVVEEVQSFFYAQQSAFLDAGIAPERIVFDPGIGFGKNVEHNIELIRSLNALRNGLTAPVALLVGLSRKSLIGALTVRPVSERLIGSVVGAIAAIERGANIVRVHDVAATRDALKVWQALAKEQ
jgi:dihydropteroate synthase